MEEEIDQIIKGDHTRKPRPGSVLVENFTLPEYYLEVKEAIDNLEIYDDDIWLCGFPKCGTTWLAEMVWLIANNLDYEKAKASILERAVILDYSFVADPSKYAQIDNVPELFKDALCYINNLPRPRIIRTHLPFSLLPKQLQSGDKNARIIQIARNPLDVCVSYYHMNTSLAFTGTAEEFYKIFLAGEIAYSPFWEHVSSFWKVKDKPNVLLLKYENLKERLGAELQKISHFLGKTVSDEEITVLEKYLSFKNLKHKTGTDMEEIYRIYSRSGKPQTPFMRSGTVGSYKNEMSEKYIEIFNKWSQMQLQGTGLHYQGY